MKKVLSSFFCVFISGILLHAQIGDSTLHLGSVNTNNSLVKNTDSSSTAGLDKSFKSLASVKPSKGIKSPFDSFKKKKKVDLHARIFNETSYVNSNPNAYNGVYTKTGIAPSATVLGIPLKGELSIATQNNQVRLDYSTASLQFEMPEYKSQIKENYLKYIGNISHFYPPGEAAAVSKISDTVKRMDDCQKMISSPNYDKDLNSLIGQVKSLEDSSKGHPLDSTQSGQYKTLTDSIKTLQAYAKDYQLAQTYINTHQQDLRKYLQYQDYIKLVKSTADITDIPRAYNDLKTKKLLDKKTEFFSGIQKFAIGKINLNYSPFTLYNQNIYGLNIEYLLHNLFFVGGGVGVPSVFNFGFSPQFFNQVTTTVKGVNRFLGFLRLGIGKVKDNHLHLIYYAYTQKFSSTGEYAMNMPPANSVLSLDFLHIINKDIKFSSEAALSNSSYLYRSASFAPIGRDDSTKALILNYAFRAALDGIIKKTSTTFNAKVQLVSNNFATVGNPFLRRGYMESSVNFKQDLFDKRITVSDIVIQSIIGVQQPGNTFQTISNNITLMYKAGSVANFSCSYIYMKEMPLGINENPNNFLQHTVSFLQQYSAKIKKTKAITFITSTLSMSQNKSTEISSNNMSVQNGLKESFIFKIGIGFQPGFGVILSNYGNLPTSINIWHTGYWVEAGNSFNIKKGITIQYNARYGIDKILGNSLNVSSTFSVKIFKTLVLNSRCQIALLQSSSVIPGNQNINVGGGLSYSW